MYPIWSAGAPLPPAPSSAATPAPFTGSTEGLDIKALDPRCRKVVGDLPDRFLEPFLQGREAELDALRGHRAVEALEAALVRDGIGSGHTLVVSLSGGVDSMAHAAILKMLCPKFGYRLAALHMRHLNRDDAADEEGWVATTATRLGLPLYSYRVLLQRPHGNVRTGISRERYEDVTKRIRFRMYRRVLSLAATATTAAPTAIPAALPAGPSAQDRPTVAAAAVAAAATPAKPAPPPPSGGTPASEADAGVPADGVGNGQRGRERATIGLVVMGHHNDDADENRLAELGKGNLVEIDGMSTLSACFGVGLYRPLLDHRKALMFDFADAAMFPYMVDSTPRWSRRGWTRRTLDAIPEDRQAAMLDELERLGGLSNALAADLALQVGSQLDAAEVTITLDPRAKDTGAAATSHRVVLITVGSVVDAAVVIGRRVEAILELVRPLAVAWNAAIDTAKAVHKLEMQRRRQQQQQQPAGGGNGNGDGSAEAAVQDCPLQPIKLHNKPFDARLFVFTYAVKSQLREQPAVAHMRGTQAAAKSLAHLWSMVAKQKEGSTAVWGALNQQCPCAWIPEPGCLAMFEPELSPRLAQQATLKRNFIAACKAALAQDRLPPSRETLPCDRPISFSPSTLPPLSHVSALRNGP